MAFLIISLFLFLYICNFSINWVFIIFESNTILSFIFYVSAIFFIYGKNFLYNLNTKYKFEIFLNMFKNNFLHIFYIFTKIISNLSHNNIRWKPLFKKTSYFGLYRTNKHQWLNK